MGPLPLGFGNTSIASSCAVMLPLLMTEPPTIPPLTTVRPANAVGALIVPPLLTVPAIVDSLTLRPPVIVPLLVMPPPTEACAAEMPTLTPLLMLAFVELTIDPDMVEPWIWM